MRIIGHSKPSFIIAEAGVNHGGSTDKAKALIDAARKAGADCIKFRAYKSEHMVGAAAPRTGHHGGNGGEREWFERNELSGEALGKLKAHAEQAGIEFCASVFDIPSLERVIELGVPLLKIPSAEITHRPLVEACAKSGLPCLVSTGASTSAEITRALGWHRLAARGGDDARYGFEGGGNVALLHCVTGYPAPVEQANLRAISRLRQNLHVPVGYSDHAANTALVPVAVAAGACIVQKALTLARGDSAQDAVSATPAEFAEMVARVREIEAFLGDGRKRAMPAEQSFLAHARKLVVAARDLRKGAVLSPSDLALKRPSNGAAGVIPQDLPRLVGKALLCDVQADAPMRWEFIGGSSEEEPSWFGQKPPREKPSGA